MSEPYSSIPQEGEPSPPLPKKIGRYTIDGLYTQGGMGVLFLATDPLTHEHILIKVLLPRFLSDKEIVEQFINEGRIIAMSDHPNIVKLYEYGSWEEGVFIAMELVRGTSLRKLLQHNPLPLKKALEVLMQVCYAVSHLHSHGISHGDLKPENILVTDEGQVKLIDFGIAKVLSSTTPGLERFTGTPIYMSPEAQKNPKKLPLQSDIYSLGIIAYELVMGKITHGRVIITLAPKGLQPILTKALQPSPKDRYQDINDFLQDISEYIHSGSCQKDKQGVDFFFELFEQLEASQKELLTSLIPKENPHLSITTSYGVYINALYFREYSHQNKTTLILAEGAAKGVQGIIETFRIHTLLESLKEQFSGISLVEAVFQEAKKQKMTFRYSALVINRAENSFQWSQNGWGMLFYIENANTRCVSRIQEQELKKSFANGDRFVLVGCEVPSLLEFSSLPLVPIDIALLEAIQSTCSFTPEKQTASILQKLRLRGGCVVDDRPVCIMSLQASEI
jgi:serine/threonine protein kinase